MNKFVLFLFWFNLHATQAQTDLNGHWQGILVKIGTSQNQSNLFHLEIKNELGKITGKSREEIFKTELYGLASYTGTQSGEEIYFKQNSYTKKQGNSKTIWCKLEAKLKYNSTSGYLEGNYTSPDCRQNAGKIILFRTKEKWNDEKNILSSHGYRDVFIRELDKGLVAPEIRAKNRENFVFEPIFFDYDQAIIRSEYFPFLNRIVDVVNGHSDLRVKVIGNTDADGSDVYNNDLSKRRAEAIIDFFVKAGIAADRIEIAFNGEKKPIDRNDTKEGKQRNRRVEFEFI